VRQQEQLEPVISGRILVAGTGYLVLTGMWLILTYFRHEGHHEAVAVLNGVLALLHVATGLGIYKRLRLAWYGGLAVAALGVAAAIPNAYPFPVGPELVIAVLLYLSRADFPATGRT
jgi:hypothetical protein